MRDKDRTKKQYNRYMKVLKDGRAKDLTKLNLVREFRYWLIVENEYPYDVFAKTHHILTPRRKFAKETDMTEKEATELKRIKSILNGEKFYDIILENFDHKKSDKIRWHLHLIQYIKL